MSTAGPAFPRMLAEILIGKVAAHHTFGIPAIPPCVHLYVCGAYLNNWNIPMVGFIFLTATQEGFSAFTIGVRP